MARHMLLTALIVAGIYFGTLFAIGHPFVASASTVETQSQPAKTDINTNDSVATTTKHTAKGDKTTKFAGATIFGVSSIVNLNNAQQEVNQVWQKLINNQVLNNNVDWMKGNIRVYAYFREFNDDFSQATLSIGYHSDDLQLNTDLPPITLPNGAFERFKIDPNTGAASDQAWAQAYIHNNLIERHRLNSNGEPIKADAIVIQQ